MELVTNRDKEVLDNHAIANIKRLIDGLFEYSSIKLGDIGKSQGDVVLVNVKPTQQWVDLETLLGHFLHIGKIETKGIYTNIYFGRKFFLDTLRYITQNKKSL